jgi:putative ABC transport system ATP-binding protein
VTLPLTALAAAQAPAASNPLVSLRAVGKSYDLPSGSFRALEGAELQIGAGEFVAIVGRSGSGKSTLLNLVAGIDRASDGEIRIGGVDVGSLSEAGLARWRGRTVGLVFQFFQLLPTLTAAENVMIPMDFANSYPGGERRGRALALLERMGVADQADKLPASLSGGQQQRVAIARALANDPPLLLADEPTGNLDSQTAAAVLALFRELAAGGTTIVMATHERDAREAVDRTIVLADGRIIEDSRRAAAAAAPVAAAS